MYQKITQLRVLSLFMDNPYEKYYLREGCVNHSLKELRTQKWLDRKR
jgi:hypothetical protein